ncbi:MFS transporter [Kitasatospora nipponensis]|uniref:MFS transporter n=1 Tax=Kitasatospora nipponensis TaxID=258049 RepID=A0ABN1T983_9ACTN
MLRRPAATARPRALGHRDFRLLWIGQSVSEGGNAATRVVLPLVAVTTLHASAFTMGLLSAAAWLPWLLIGLPAGAWVDRVRRRPVLIGANLLSAAVLLAVTAAAWLHRLTVGQLLLAVALCGAANVFFSAAYGAYVPELLPEELLVDGNAKLELSGSAAELVAPSAGGALVQAGGAALGFLADTVSFLLSTALLVRIRTTERPPAVRTGGSLRAEIRTGIRFLTADPYLRTILFCDAGMNLFLCGSQAVVVLFLSRTVGLGGGSIGVLFGLVGLGAVAGAALAPRLGERLGSARALLLCALGGTPFGLLVPLTGRGAGLLAFLVGDFCLTAAVVASNVIIISFRQARTPPELLGRVGSAIRFVMYGTIPLGGLLAGTLGSAVGPRATLGALYAGAVLCSLLLLRGPLRTLRTLPDPEPTPAPEPEPTPEPTPARP